MADRFATLQPYFPKLGPPQTSNPDKTELSYEPCPNGDGKSVYNPPREGRSHHYDALYKGEQDGVGEKPWWDFHVYHLVSSVAKACFVNTAARVRQIRSVGNSDARQPPPTPDAGLHRLQFVDTHSPSTRTTSSTRRSCTKPCAASSPSSACTA